MFKLRIWRIGSLTVLALALQVPFAAVAIDWSKVEGKTVSVFYPGQSSWEWALTTSDHDGAKDIRKGKTCWDCHEGEEQEIGSKIVSGKELEPHPPAGMRPAFDVIVKAANDGEKLYIQLTWPEAGGNVAEKEDPQHEAKATILLGDKKLVAFDRGGCWSACHDDLEGMPSDAGNELTKYLTDSRSKVTRQGGGENYKSADALSSLLEEGKFIEYWQALLNKGSASPADGYILDKMHENQTPAVSVEAENLDGNWVVVLSRSLNTPGTGRRQLASGAVVPIGIAIHDAYADGRHHHVSFERTLGIDSGKADIVAAKQ